MKILIVEDSARLRRSLAKGLEDLGHAIDAAEDGRQGLAFALTYDYEIIVLDLMLPRLSGLELLAELRRKGDKTHVLILSAKDQVEDRVRGLEMGADDYLVKPFSFDELQARIQALGRRLHHEKDPRIQLGPLVLDTSARTVRRGGDQVELTPSEYTLLECLARRRGHVISKTQLLDQLHPSDSEVSSNVIEVLVHSLRKKIHLAGEEPIVRTKRGFGYYVEPS